MSLPPQPPPAAERRPRRRGSRLLLGLALVVGLVLVPALGLELWLRLARDRLDLWQLTGRAAGANPMRRWAQVDAFNAFRGRPGSTALGKSISSQGFISTPEVALPKPPDRVRIVFLGGSSTAGTGFDLADEDTWPWRSVEQLRERLGADRVDFINGALGGYSSFESFGRLWSRLRFYEPDVVVVSHAWNDLYYFDRADAERLLGWRTLPDGDWTLDRSRGGLAILEPSWVDPLFRHSQLLIRARVRLARWRAGSGGELGAGGGDLATSFDPAAVEAYRTNLRLMRETCAVLGAELFVIQQPTLIVPGLAEEHRERCRYEFHGFDHDAHVAAYAAIHRVIEEEIDPSRVLDLTSLSGQPALFHDHVHPTVRGAQVIAAVVADRLEAYLRGRGG